MFNISRHRHQCFLYKQDNCWTECDARSVSFHISLLPFPHRHPRSFFPFSPKSQPLLPWQPLLLPDTDQGELYHTHAVGFPFRGVIEALNPSVSLFFLFVKTKAAEAGWKPNTPLLSGVQNDSQFPPPWWDKIKTKAIVVHTHSQKQPRTQTQHVDELQFASVFIVRALAIRGASFYRFELRSCLKC